MTEKFKPESINSVAESKCCNPDCRAWYADLEAWADEKAAEEAQEDALLMQAAPDLLNALYAALPYVEDALEDPCYKPKFVQAVLKLIHAALAKAGTQ
jgi:hypothetical protein